MSGCPPETVFLAAVSGGADSTAMLAALAAVRDSVAFQGQNPAFELHCIHIEHGIRPPAESQGDAAFVRSLCERLSVPCRVITIKPGKIAATAKVQGIGIEAAARLYRRKAWFREARRLKAPRLQAPRLQAALHRPVRILTAHTADDMLETVLMRILRGAGPAGLAAMPVSRGRLLRPLLTVTRSDVLNYLKDKNIAWREDSSNADTVFLRNRIRHRLIPHFNDHFPHWRGTLTALAETQSLAAEFICTEASHRILWEAGTGDKGLGNMSTSAENFFAQPPIIREEALFQGIDTLGISGNISRMNIRRMNIRRFCEGNSPAVDLGFIQLRKTAQQVTITAIPQSPAPHSEYGFSLLIKAPGSYNLKGIALEVASLDGEYPVNKSGQGNEFFSLLPLVVRPCFRDDYITGSIERRDRKITPADLQFPGVGFTAVDSLGPAAFISSAGLLQCRAAHNGERLMAVVAVKGMGV